MSDRGGPASWGRLIGKRGPRAGVFDGFKNRMLFVQETNYTSRFVLLDDSSSF